MENKINEDQMVDILNAVYSIMAQLSRQKIEVFIMN